jgi:hypothetical protein
MCTAYDLIEHRRTVDIGGAGAGPARLTNHAGPPGRSKSCSTSSHTDEAWTTANQHPDVISETLWHDLLSRHQVTRMPTSFPTTDGSPKAADVEISSVRQVMPPIRQVGWIESLCPCALGNLDVTVAPSNQFDIY